MSDRKYGAALELIIYELLNFSLSLDIDVCSGFVKQDDFVLSKDGSADS